MDLSFLADMPDPFVFCYCTECDWEGKPTECETYEEQDGYENPSYLVATCPKCDGDTVVFLRQSELEG